MNLKNKKGDKLISIYWFTILVIVATGIVVMVNVFYSSPYDVRQLESEILSQKVADCIYSGGEMNSFLITPQGNFREDFKDRFFERCSLNFETGDELKKPQYYLEVNFYFGENFKEKQFSIIEGNLNLKTDCNGLKDKNLPTCVEKEFFARNSNGALYLIKILSVVGKVEQNAN